MRIPVQFYYTIGSIVYAFIARGYFCQYAFTVSHNKIDNEIKVWF